MPGLLPRILLALTGSALILLSQAVVDISGRANEASARVLPAAIIDGTVQKSDDDKEISLE